MEAHKSPYRKGPWYGTFRFQKGVDHSFAMLDEARHTALRTKVGPGYSGTILVVRDLGSLLLCLLCRGRAALGEAVLRLSRPCFACQG